MIQYSMNTLNTDVFMLSNDSNTIPHQQGLKAKRYLLRIGLKPMRTPLVQAAFDINTPTYTIYGRPSESNLP